MAVFNYISIAELQAQLSALRARAGTEEGRRDIARHWESTVRRSKLGGLLLDKVQLMYRFYRDPATPIKPKLLIGGGLLYLILPTDLLPDWLAVVGFTDDIAVLTIIWRQVQHVLSSYAGDIPPQDHALVAGEPAGQ